MPEPQLIGTSNLLGLIHEVRASAKRWSRSDLVGCRPRAVQEIIARPAGPSAHPVHPGPTKVLELSSRALQLAQLHRYEHILLGLIPRGGRAAQCWADWVPT